ncbi:4-diphosphocytidyl-2-C-methyl-D-erythritol kinase [Persephonella hydrogeniphila]|uniref:4-diphosphocytidyl-2-C-methyl-D-erythritol kinase n=1 Tax=Persephonella hydrogeniphila TaxID=198703 RepID=A0A285NGW8_9AQUI|nr:4-(cytidine 5'-diphospho)-2-C-methyl-D-erythritol kinase [Persephonella hydrogeniphila]SNZ08689.1 4-diphosphocytidyl-2-C-methyl-D-erythritol kinase [Persephonella hydrogeniphila]
MYKLESPAKINLGLWVLGKRPDGYHEIFTIFHTISLHDRITIKPSYTQKVETSSPLIKSEENIVLKTLQKFEEWTGIKPEFEIFIEKNIPVGAGLGGGSSNAATVLKFVNEFYNSPLSEDELFTLATQLGADVPFFLKGGMALGEGIGEKLKFLEKSFSEDIFIIYPNIQIKTSEVYSKITPEMLTKKEDIHIIDSLLDDIEKLMEYIENTLGKIVEESYPQVKEVLNTLRFMGYKPVVSGSGSSVFVVGTPTEKVEKICQFKGWKLIKTALK